MKGHKLYPYITYYGDTKQIYKCDMTSPTEKQISYIKGICDVLEIDYKELKTKDEATAWLSHFVPLYKRKCEENELEWEANHSDIMSNYGDWRD